MKRKLDRCESWARRAYLYIHMVLYLWQQHTSIELSIVTQKQINTVRTQQTHAAQCVSCAFLFCILLKSLAVQERRKNTRSLKISCSISHIKLARPLTLFLFLLHYVTLDLLLWQTTLRSPHIWTKLNLVTLQRRAFIGLFATLYWKKSGERIKKMGKRLGMWCLFT